jgi:hypothetical protein
MKGGTNTRFAARHGLLPTLHRQGSGHRDSNSLAAAYAKEYENQHYRILWTKRLLAVLSVVVLLYVAAWKHISVGMGRSDTPAATASDNPGEFDGHIVLAVATNTSTESLNIFVQSWAMHAPGNRIVVFAETDLLEAPGTAQFLKDYRVESVPVHRPKQIDDIFDEEEVPKPGRLALASLRQVAKYVQGTGHGVRVDWRRVKGVALVTTAGDVVLQGDPFGDTSVRQYIPKQGVVFALQGGPEIGKVKVSKDVEMMNSLRDCFGGNMAEKMGKLPLINGHVVIGAHKGMAEFLDLVVDVLATRTRERCLSHPRADLAAIQYSVGEFGRDPRNVDFAFSLRDHVTSTVYGALYGLPAKIDTAGMLRRRPPEGSARRGPTPTVISQYSSSSYLTMMYKGRYSWYARERVDFDTALK